MSESVLVLRALGLGDALTGVAALRGVRRAWPTGRIVLAAPAGVGRWLCRRGLADDLLPTTGLTPLHSVGDRYDVAVNLHGRGPQSHQVLRATRPGRLVAFRCPETGLVDGPGWRLDEHEVDRWCRLVRSVGGWCGPEDLRLAHSARRERYVVVHPGAAAASRRWPAGRWTEVVEILVSRGVDVVVTGGPDERELCRDVAGDLGRDVSGSLDLEGLADVVARARVVLCGDTGVGHLATAYATPSVLLFGPMPPVWWGPSIDPHLHTVLWHGDPANPVSRDPHGDVLDPALARIEAGEVVEAAETLLAGARSRRSA